MTSKPWRDGHLITPNGLRIRFAVGGFRPVSAISFRIDEGGQLAFTGDLWMQYYPAMGKTAIIDWKAAKPWLEDYRAAHGDVLITASYMIGEIRRLHVPIFKLMRAGLLDLISCGVSVPDVAS